MTNRIMYDSVNLRGIPRPLPKGALVAYYIDGPYVPPAGLAQELFPGTKFNFIDPRGTAPSLGRTLDVENGDATPASCQGWIAEFNAKNPAYKNGARPVMYCNRSTIPDVRTGTGRYVLGKDYYLWVADPGGMYTGPGVIACQNVWAHSYDSSVVFSDAFLP